MLNFVECHIFPAILKSIKGTRLGTMAFKVSSAAFENEFIYRSMENRRKKIWKKGKLTGRAKDILVVKKQQLPTSVSTLRGKNQSKTTQTLSLDCI